MKLKSFLATFVLCLPTVAFAGEKNSANVVFDQPLVVAGTQLAPGQYKLTWTGDGSNVTVTFEKGRKTVATAPAKLQSTPHGEDAVEVAPQSDHTAALIAVDFDRLTLQFQLPSNSAGN
jgi:hypothetical protein